MASKFRFFLCTTALTAFAGTAAAQTIPTPTPTLAPVYVTTPNPSATISPEQLSEAKQTFQNRPFANEFAPLTLDSATLSAYPTGTGGTTTGGTTGGGTTGGATAGAAAPAAPPAPPTTGCCDQGEEFYKHYKTTAACVVKFPFLGNKTWSLTCDSAACTFDSWTDHCKIAEPFCVHSCETMTKGALTAAELLVVTITCSTTAACNSTAILCPVPPPPVKTATPGPIQAPTYTMPMN